MFPSKEDIKFLYDAGFYATADLEAYQSLGYLTADDVAEMTAEEVRLNVTETS